MHISSDHNQVKRMNNNKNNTYRNKQTNTQIQQPVKRENKSPIKVKDIFD